MNNRKKPQFVINPNAPSRVPFKPDYDQEQKMLISKITQSRPTLDCDSRTLQPKMPQTTSGSQTHKKQKKKRGSNLMVKPQVLNSQRLRGSSQGVSHPNTAKEGARHLSGLDEQISLASKLQNSDVSQSKIRQNAHIANKFSNISNKSQLKSYNQSIEEYTSGTNRKIPKQIAHPKLAGAVQVNHPGNSSPKKPSIQLPAIGVSGMSHVNSVPLLGSGNVSQINGSNLNVQQPEYYARSNSNPANQQLHSERQTPMNKLHSRIHHVLHGPINHSGSQTEMSKCASSGQRDLRTFAADNARNGPPNLGTSARNYNTVDSAINNPHYKKNLKQANDEINRLKQELDYKNKEMDVMKKGFIEWYHGNPDPSPGVFSINSTSSQQSDYRIKKKYLSGPNTSTNLNSKKKGRQSLSKNQGPPSVTHKQRAITQHGKSDKSLGQIQAPRINSANDIEAPFGPRIKKNKIFEVNDSVSPIDNLSPNNKKLSQELDILEEVDEEMQNTRGFQNRKPLIENNLPDIKTFRNIPIQRIQAQNNSEIPPDNPFWSHENNNRLYASKIDPPSPSQFQFAPTQTPLIKSNISIGNAPPQNHHSQANPQYPQLPRSNQQDSQQQIQLKKRKSKSSTQNYPEMVKNSPGKGMGMGPGPGQGHIQIKKVPKIKGLTVVSKKPMANIDKFSMNQNPSQPSLPTSTNGSIGNLHTGLGGTLNGPIPPSLKMVTAPSNQSQSSNSSQQEFILRKSQSSTNTLKVVRRSQIRKSDEGSEERRVTIKRVSGQPSMGSMNSMRSSIGDQKIFEISVVESDEEESKIIEQYRPIGIINHEVFQDEQPSLLREESLRDQNPMRQTIESDMAQTAKLGKFPANDICSDVNSQMQNFQERTIKNKFQQQDNIAQCGRIIHQTNPAIHHEEDRGDGTDEDNSGFQQSVSLQQNLPRVSSAHEAADDDDICMYDLSVQQESNCGEEKKEFDDSPRYNTKYQVTPRNFDSNFEDSDNGPDEGKPLPSLPLNRYNQNPDRAF